MIMGSCATPCQRSKILSIYNDPINLNQEKETVLVRDLPDAISEQPALQDLSEIEIPEHLKDPADADSMNHRRINPIKDWKRIPAFKDVDESTFYDWKFQNKNSVTSVDALEKTLGNSVAPGFMQDVRRGTEIAPMVLRLSPYVLSQIDWENPIDDPLRRQFIPVGSTYEPDHPMLTLDSLNEQGDSPVKGLVHRYPDKALFLALDVCPVYCRFCTRSYAIGNDTSSVEKVSYRVNKARWYEAFAYIASRPELEDIVVSGGDTYMLTPKALKEIGTVLLDIPHIRRVRFASKGLAVMPMKILTHNEWTDTLLELAKKGRQMGKEVCLHTHFNTTNEITETTKQAMDLLFREGLKVRNQTVLIRGVNDTVEEMQGLMRQLAFLNIQPYYVYQHDMVKGVEELRTSVSLTQEIERHVRGSLAGFNTPTFVNDVPGGGGKRDVHSYDHYNPTTGVSVYRSPSVEDAKAYLYFDPISQLPPDGRLRWKNPREHGAIIAEALIAASLEDYHTDFNI
jgi:lysine 2,3-aminomutase